MSLAIDVGCEVCLEPLDDDCTWCMWFPEFCDTEDCGRHHKECCDCDPAAKIAAAEASRRTRERTRSR